MVYDTRTKQTRAGDSESKLLQGTLIAPGQPFGNLATEPVGQLTVPPHSRRVKESPHQFPQRPQRFNHQTWGTIHQAIKRLELGNVDGIGLVVTEADPYCFVDVDHSADRQKRLITSELGLRVATLLNTLSEFSPNDGLHFLVKLEKPLPEACKSDVEL